uniref:NADH-ubiquinone oxidoreductase chain 3 n=1 Tax=Siphoninus phillyreae TaxID=7040 RepID=Q6JCP6_9HEMI|nr:NADH dehydrogenase subunit 3 [Siphoninus phillyreae]
MNFMKITIMMIAIIVTVIIVLTMVFKMASIKSKPSYQKNCTFECGFDLMAKLRLPFSINFFMISIIFLIFDIELILLLPFIFLMKMNKTKTSMLILVMFFLVLMLGFIYEWWMGWLNWLI